MKEIETKTLSIRTRKGGYLAVLNLVDLSISNRKRNKRSKTKIRCNFIEMEHPMTKHALYVCKSCAFSLTQRDDLGERGGKYLFYRVSDLSENWVLKSEFAIKELVCLSACKRPCSILHRRRFASALTGANKTSLMFGDLCPVDSAEAILQLCDRYYRSTDGIISRNERPEILQKSILARIPPSPS